MKTDFVDFWSANRWLCQYNIVIEDDCQWVDQAIIVHPLAETPYRSTDRFKYWQPDKLQNYLLKLDRYTVKLSTIQQNNRGLFYPAFEYILFPCPDGNYYAGYPAENPIVYVRSFTFSLSNFPGRTEKERDDNYHAWWMECGQSDLAFTARRLFTCILRAEREI